MCQIWGNTTVTGLCIPDISGVTPLQQQDCLRVISFGRLQMWSNTAAIRDCVRVNSFGTGSQHIPDLEQHFYHMQENSFVRFDNPDLKQHRCYGTVYVLNRLCIMYYYEFGLFCVAFIL